MNEFKPITYSGGYLPIEDHGLIGDGSTAALVGSDGAVSWMCAPRFDFDSLCDQANALGLLPEQIDPSTGAFLGNFPQAFSHVGLISSAVNLARTKARTSG